MIMIKTFSEEMLGLPGRPQPIPPPKEYSESLPAEKSEKQMLAKVTEARRNFLSQITHDPMNYAKSCSSCLQLMDMDGEDYASTNVSRATSARSSHVELMSVQSSIDESRIERLMREYDENHLNSIDDDGGWAGQDDRGRRVSFDLGRYLYM